MHVLKTVLQVGMLLGVAMLGNSLTHMLNLNFPGSILGIVLVFILLQAKIIRLEWVEAGANILIAELMLFFIPSAVGVIQYKQLMISDGMRFGIVILCSTITVMIFTGLMSEMANKFGEER